MASIYFTGDIHGDPIRLANEKFPDNKKMRDGQDNNFVIICGDFGLIWDSPCESKSERFYLNWLEERNFTTLFVSGNHENFDRLNSTEYPIEEWNGGLVQKIRPHVIHLRRGEIYDILGKKIFAFGGARSHDIRDGILDPIEDKELIKEWRNSYYKMFRVNHVSWWKEEMASQEEMEYGIQNLARHNNKVDYIVTHCAPQQVCYMLSLGSYESDPMTMYFDKIAQTTQFEHWFCGHYHCNERVMMKFDVLYENIMRVF